MSEFRSKNYCLTFFVLILVSVDVLAAQVEPEVKPVNLLLKEMGTPKISGAKKVADAHKALLSNKFDRVISLSSAIKNDELFSDWGWELSAQAWVEKGIIQCRKRQYKVCRENLRKAHFEFLQIQANRPDSPFLEEISKNLARVEIEIAQSYFKQNLWDRSQTFFERAFQRRMGKHLLPEIPKEAFSQYPVVCTKTKSPACGCMLRRLLRSFPERASEREAIGKIFPRLLTESQPSRESQTTVRYRAPDEDAKAIDEAMSLYLTKHDSQALEKLGQFLKIFPKSTHRFRARYWIAKLLKKDGEEDQANSLFASVLRETPLSYYGLLSSLESKQSVGESIISDIPMATRFATYQNPDDAIKLKRAEQFLRLKKDELAAVELRNFRPSSLLESPFLVYLAALNQEASNDLTSFIFLGELFNRGYEGVNSTFIQRMIFPLRFPELINKYASQHKLSPVLVMSLIKQESAFMENAISSSGALGLMQLMPFTALDIDPNIPLSKLDEADTNIRIGSAYLARVLKKFDGNVALTLAGYNAGPTKVARWKEASESWWGLLEFIESIPYKETREYVSGIIRNYFWYHYRIKGKRLTSLNLFWTS